MVEYKELLNHKVSGFVVLFLIFLGWHLEDIIMSIPAVDENLLWLLSPFAFIIIAMTGCLAFQESRLTEMEKRITVLETSKK